MQNQNSSQSLGTIEIIDVHNHIFPDKIALRAAENIRDYYGFSDMEGDGTSATLQNLARALNVRHFIISSAATKPNSVGTANDYIHEMTFADPIYIGLGTTHAGFADHKKELVRVKMMGLRGLKIHPDFQGFPINDERLFPAYDAASELDLPILFHVGDENSSLSEAKKLRFVMDKFPQLTVIAAHMGGYKKKAEAEEYLVGTRAYFDTSEWHNYLKPDELLDMIRRHGIEKIMYGCDYPLNSPYTSAKALFNCDLTEKEKRLIFSGNAKKLFRIDD
ncbi:hypothetical protein SDC9_123048 [bioreactor metagenome]|uniref:Amidohydrolase-related domain-containing protein n=1 Tax=bioreactor metagenome TaxID=1076179 RepID=A0A645CGL3_9ZZZZ|nr:amidohydrolase family protein [Oscillospiraceae bacterium]